MNTNTILGLVIGIILGGAATYFLLPMQQQAETTPAMTAQSTATAKARPMIQAVDGAAADGAIKHRRAIFRALGGHTGAVASIVKGEVPFTKDLPGHAHAIKELSLIVSSIFPPGSDFGETNTKPEAWSRLDEFAEATSKFQAAAANLAKVAPEGNMAAIGNALGALGKTCKNCHEDFREKKE